jgi:hypothetical protein
MEGFSGCWIWRVVGAAARHAAPTVPPPLAITDPGRRARVLWRRPPVPACGARTPAGAAGEGPPFVWAVPRDAPPPPGAKGRSPRKKRRATEAFPTAPQRERSEEGMRREERRPFRSKEGTGGASERPFSFLQSPPSPLRRKGCRCVLIRGRGVFGGRLGVSVESDDRSAVHGRTTRSSIQLNSSVENPLLCTIPTYKKWKRATKPMSWA